MLVHRFKMQENKHLLNHYNANNLINKFNKKNYLFNVRFKNHFVSSLFAQLIRTNERKYLRFNNLLLNNTYSEIIICVG